MKFFTKEVKIAIVTIIGIVVLFYGLQFLKGLSIFGNSDGYYVSFTDVSGVAASTPVYANGYKVGVVEEVLYDYSPQGKLIAVMALDKRMRLPRGSKAEISSDLLGNIKINLLLGDDPVNMVAKGDTIPGGVEGGMMSKLSKMMPAVEALLPKLDSIMTSLNILLADPALQQTLHNVEGMTSNLNATSSEHLAAIDVAGMTASVNQTLANVNEMTRKLNSNEGTLGLLMRDATLYHNLTNTVADADSLLVDLKAHPKRYVHFSIFGSKTK